MNDIGIERLFSYRISVEYCQYFNRLYEIIFEPHQGTLKRKKRIALVAHDEKKEDLLEWVKYNEKKLATHELWAKGTTGGVISENCSL
jgi:hypothetical protein